MLHTRRSRSAFTLVELLVVIAIIGILVALLLPAVQAAREAGRRSSCSNNLKQMALAVHNFHDTKKYLPHGGGADLPPWGTATGGGWGSSWLVRILPFMEQNPMYEQFRFTGNQPNGTGSSTSGWGSPNATNNCIVASKIVIDAYYCPSSQLEKFCNNPHNAGPIMAPTYVGIAGAVTNPPSGPGGLPIPRLPPTSPPSFAFVEQRQRTPNGAAGCCSGGIAVSGGVLIPGGGRAPKTFSAVQDGTSNTAMIGEQGDFMVTVNGKREDYRASFVHGWIIGWHTINTPGGSPDSGNNQDNRIFNVTSVRYPINDKKNIANNNLGWTDNPGNCGVQGVCFNASHNLPLNSTHPGGAQVALADGSVRWLDQVVDRATLAKLCIRDDGQSATPP